MSILQRRRFSIIALALCTTSLVAAPSIDASASIKNPTASSVLNAAKASIAKESSVHIKVTSKAGPLDSKLVVDIGKTTGLETITSGKDNVTISITSSYAYLRGSAAGLTGMMGLTAAEQKKVGNKTIAMKAGTAQYSSFKANLTSSVLVGLLPALKGTTLTSTTLNKKKVYDLNWSTKSSGTTPATSTVLTLSTTKLTLPVQETIKSKSGGGTTTFSHWGETFKVPVPSSSTIIAYSKVFA